MQDCKSAELLSRTEIFSELVQAAQNHDIYFIIKEEKNKKISTSAKHHRYGNMKRKKATEVVNVSRRIKGHIDGSFDCLKNKLHNFSFLSLKYIFLFQFDIFILVTVAFWLDLS